jgi:hypothetical protein
MATHLEMRTPIVCLEVVEIAFLANAEAASVALVDVAARPIVATLDVDPARVKSEGPVP